MNVVVYHIFCVGDYLDVVNKQVTRIKESGLYEWVDSIYVSCVDINGEYLGIDELFEGMDKVNLFKTTQNHYEWWGISKVWELSQHNEGKVLYLHTKGVSNKYVKIGHDEISDLKVKGISWWKEMLEYFVIDNWRQCVDALDNVDNCGATCINGWWWGNFWWANLSWTKNNQQPVQADRWYFEAWVNFARTPKIKEFYHFTFNPYFSILPDDLYRVDNWYQGKNVEIIYGEYGVFGIQQDEGQFYQEKTVVDVTDILIKNFEENNKKSLQIRAHNELKGDPIFGHRKFLIIKLKADEEILQYCVNEGMNLELIFER